MNPLILAIVLTVLQAVVPGFDGRPVEVNGRGGDADTTAAFASSPTAPARGPFVSPDPILVPAEYVFTSEPLTAGEFFHVLSQSPWPEDEWVTVSEVAYCESRWFTTAVGRLGELGLLQVRPEFHGPVPADPLGQLTQAYSIWDEYGWQPWSCAP